MAECAACGAKYKNDTVRFCSGCGTARQFDTGEGNPAELKAERLNQRATRLEAEAAAAKQKYEQARAAAKEAKEALAAAPSTSAPSSPAKFCGSCGGGYKSNEVRFCSNCGTPRKGFDSQVDVLKKKAEEATSVEEMRRQEFETSQSTATKARDEAFHARAEATAAASAENATHGQKADKNAQRNYVGL
eukprot:g14112.t1